MQKASAAFYPNSVLFYPYKLEMLNKIIKCFAEILGVFSRYMEPKSISIPTYCCLAKQSGLVTM